MTIVSIKKIKVKINNWKRSWVIDRFKKNIK